jgi:exopolysaccharide biosynthesis polyprenyl glycosylphosphotransferase
MPAPRRSTLVLLLLDGLAIFVAFNAFAWMRGIAGPGNWLGPHLLGPGVLLAAAVYLIDGYGERTDFLSADYASLHAIAGLAALVGTLILTFVVIPSDYPLQGSRAVIVLGFGATLPATLLVRRNWRLRSLRHARHRHVLFIGDAASCAAFAEDCARQTFDRQILFADPGGTSAGGGAADSRPPVAVMLDRIRSGEVAVEAVVWRETGRAPDPALAEPLVELYFEGVPTYTLELFHQVYWRKIPLYRLNQTWLFQEGFQIAREPVFVRLKRVADIALASLTLLAAAPVLAVAALAVRIGDGGPVFFRQRRIGRNRVPFTLVKLRSMRPAGNGADGAPLSDEQRITGVGRLLRASRVDELPQLWNVLRGEMSLIGPRAEWDELVRRYEREIPCYHFRHLVKPGITGWAQVNHPYGSTLENTRSKLEYDLYYIRHFSFALDASIVLKTLHIMLFGKGR